MNVTVACPQCGTHYSIQRELLGRRSKCAKCGVAFMLSESPPNVMPVAAAEPAVDPTPAVESPPEFGALPQIDVTPPAPRARPTRSKPQPTPVSTTAASATTAPSFWALRFMAKSYEVGAIMSLVAIMIPLVLLVQSVIRFPSLASLVIIPYGTAILSLVVSALLFYLIAQLIRLVLQVEQNTRETSEACQQLVEHLGAIESDE